jgi:hypothetical protein
VQSGGPLLGAPCSVVETTAKFRPEAPPASVPSVRPLTGRLSGSHKGKFRDFVLPRPGAHRWRFDGDVRLSIPGMPRQRQHLDETLLDIRKKALPGGEKLVGRADRHWPTQTADITPRRNPLHRMFDVQLLVSECRSSCIRTRVWRCVVIAHLRNERGHTVPQILCSRCLFLACKRAALNLASNKFSFDPQVGCVGKSGVSRQESVSRSIRSRRSIALLLAIRQLAKPQSIAGLVDAAASCLVPPV